MSVAFRREGDDEHLEPKFELPIPPGPNRVTVRGLRLISERVSALAGALADLADVAADDPRVTALRREQRYWQTREITAEPVAPGTGDVVDFGTRVTFRQNGKERSIAIVGDDEADPAAGLIAWSAPLARALMGSEPGDLVDFAGKPEGIEVLRVEPYAES